MSKAHSGTKISLERYMEGVTKEPWQPNSFKPYMKGVNDFSHISKKPQYHENQILERMAEPERVISFRVPPTDDDEISGQIVVGGCNLTSDWA